MTYSKIDPTTALLTVALLASLGLATTASATTETDAGGGMVTAAQLDPRFLCNENYGPDSWSMTCVLFVRGTWICYGYEVREERDDDGEWTRTESCRYGSDPVPPLARVVTA